MNIYSRFFVLILSLFVFVSPTFATSQDIDFLETLNPFWKVPQIDASEFVFTLNIPIQNSGSVSVIPTGKITLVDDTGNTLKSIGIDGERNEIGTLLQSEVVDYIPLNPEQIKVPAGQTVSLAPEWRGFADEYIEDTVPIIVFSSPF